jgi:DHA1 family multidrug resistance protein-like MFS transporter
MNKRDKIIFGALFFSLFATVTGVGIVVPLLPVYAHDLGASGFYIGLIFGAFSLSRTFFLPYFGRLSDKKGRKPFIVTGLLAYTLISFVFMMADSVDALITIRFFQGIASAMIMPVLQAYVGDITLPGKEGLTMGLFHTALFFGLSFGPLAGGVIKDSFSLKAAFFCMGMLSLIGLLLSLFMLPPAKSERVVAANRSPKSWKTLLRDKNIIGLFGYRFAYAACIGIIWGFLPVFADMQFSLSSGSIGVLVMIGVFISGAMHTPMGFLADRMNKHILVGAGGLLLGMAILFFGWSKGFWDLFMAGILFGVGGGIAMPALMALAVMKGNVTDAMGSVMALLTVGHSLGMMVGSLLGGVMMDLFDLRHVFPLGTVIILAGVILFSLLTHQDNRPSSHSAAKKESY